MTSSPPATPAVSCLAFSHLAWLTPRPPASLRYTYRVISLKTPGLPLLLAQINETFSCDAKKQKQNICLEALTVICTCNSMSLGGAAGCHLVHSGGDQLPGTDHWLY